MPNWSFGGIIENFRQRNMPVYGVAFSGGGAKGFSHIGALMAFEKFNIRPELLSGVSAGSIAAVLYAAGLSPQDIMDCFSEYTKFSDFTEWAIPRDSFFRMDRFRKILDSWLPVKNLEELNMPTVVCATDFERGKTVSWVKGPIVERVVASCSIPIIFPPVKVDGIRCVDGGVLRNLPAEVIRPYCRTLIGCNCTPMDRNFKYKSSIVEVALRTYHLMMKANTLPDLELCDIVIQSPALPVAKTFSIKQMTAIVTHGYDCACRDLEAYFENKKK